MDAFKDPCMNELIGKLCAFTPTYASSVTTQKHQICFVKMGYYAKWTISFELFTMLQCFLINNRPSVVFRATRTCLSYLLIFR